MTNQILRGLVGTALAVGLLGVASPVARGSDAAAPPVYTNQVTSWPAAVPAPPPAAPAQRSATDLEKLVAPLALYPDPVIAVMLPASAYPVEIVMAARFIADTNNLAKIDDQEWDANVKELARFPAVIQKMSDDLAWTTELGQAFLAQDKDVMDAIQSLRAKAQSAGTLKTTPQQIVVVTNAVVERTYDQQVVYVTNTVVQVQPANPQVVYVPQYNPTTVYAPPPEDHDDVLAPLLTFGAGIALGAVIANNCDWHYGGVYMGGGGMVIVGGGGHPPYYPPPPGYRPPPYRPPPGYRPPPPGTRPPGYPPSGGGAPGGRPPPTNATSTKRWQPDQGRLGTAGAGSPAATAQSREARGWSGPGSPAARPSATPAGGASRAPAVAASPAPRSASPTPSASRATPTAGASRADTASRSFDRPSSSGGSAFGDVSSGAAARDSSDRGAASRGGGISRERSGGGFGGRAGGGGLGGRGGGGRGGRR